MTNSEAGQRPDESAEQNPDNTTGGGEHASSTWNETAAAADAQRIAELEVENADVKDRLLRLAADMENLRRRTEREVKDARQFAVASFARDMLAVADNLARALQAIPADAQDEANPGLKSLVEGVDMTSRSMLSTLERHGVRKLEPKGTRFDPNFHQAMFEMENTEVPNGTVMEVVQDGYAIGERVLRPAMVGVARGGPKAPFDPSQGTADDSSKDA
ncbi:nucleotide exchange factor GrpE [Aureimonas fodinaquatilis]|uniref:Protein GrpE n=1 Tax=Aureimonas fodinaquatilis TaxID=2565783 RepID=A0A5B0DY68_9HYPH|nr:nucleotide exchange factor GrpE [Aureimonas fodinaquatilis]KAA0971724.1 nucleotide exchange factor GrpE [Aureimonas fodinaquatilis]